MRRIIAAGIVALFALGGTATVATAAKPAKQIAALQKSVKALQKNVKKLKKTVAGQQKTIKTLTTTVGGTLLIEYCLLGATTDALQSTWTTIDQALGSSVFGPQQTIGNADACSPLRITRQGIQTPPTLVTFSALVALITPRLKAYAAPALP